MPEPLFQTSRKTPPDAPIDIDAMLEDTEPRPLVEPFFVAFELSALGIALFIAAVLATLAAFFVAGLLVMSMSELAPIAWHLADLGALAARATLCLALGVGEGCAA